MLRAGGQGLEPRSLGPKPSVLPLDDPPNYSIVPDVSPQDSIRTGSVQVVSILFAFAQEY